jgi:glycosyltransferase involved in cell wall biosynthesis
MRKRTLQIGIFTYDFYPIIGGIGRHVFELYKQEEEIKDKRVNIIFFSPTNNKLNNHVQIFKESRVSHLQHLDFSIRLNSKIEEIIKKYNLDVVHIQSGPGGVLLLKKLSIPTVITSHHTYWQQYQNIISQRWKYLLFLLEKRSYNFANRIICVSKDTQSVLERKYKINKSVLEFIPNGIDLKAIEIRKNNFRQGKNLLYLGRLDKRKGIDFLLKTIKYLNDPSIKLHIVGEGKDKNKAQIFCLNNKLSVKFYGFLSKKELDNIYKNISIQIVPSIFEGFGISILEGMARNIPIIATDVDGIKSLLEDGRTGILVKYGNIHGLANAIKNILNNISLQKLLVKNAQLELKKYDWNIIFSKHLSIYENLD